GAARRSGPRLAAGASRRGLAAFLRAGRVLAAGGALRARAAPAPGGAPWPGAVVGVRLALRVPGGSRLISELALVAPLVARLFHRIAEVLADVGGHRPGPLSHLQVALRD